jgi:hypothetical protein
MSEKIAIYIVSMGDTPDKAREFAAKFSARFHIPMEKVLALGQKLPARVGIHEMEKARLIGIEIKKMGGQVSFRRAASPAQEPIPAPSAEKDDGSWVVHGYSESSEKSPPSTASVEKEDGSWVVHGHSESQEDLAHMGREPAPEPIGPSVYDTNSSDDEWAPPPITPPPERKIAGKFEAKQVYTAPDNSALNDEVIKKVKGLYIDRKAKKTFLKSPIFRIMILLVVVSAAAMLYINKQEITDYLMGMRNTPLKDAYEDRIPPGVLLPADATGNYVGEMQYNTPSGEIAFIETTLFVEGRNLHDVVVDISSSNKEIGKYRLVIEYAPGYVKYIKTAGEKLIYQVENTFPSSANAITVIDNAGRFSFTLDAVDAQVNVLTIPDSEKDNLGNTILLKMEGAYAGDGKFYGGLITSSTPLMGWEAAKK